MADDTLLAAAGRIADGEYVDWPSITSTLPSDDQRAVADQLAVLAQIAAGHRQLHELLPVAADTPPNLVPDRARWGHLDLLNIVGRGSYGTVYRAWDTRLERLVALKLFHGASDPDAVMQEGRMLARVRHENVVTVYGADVIDGVAGLWMELVHGQTLDHIVRKSGPMAPIEAATIGVDAARALAAVHAAGLLHCDVKAQNVVQEAGGRVVLMDLGAGRVVPEARDSDQLSDVAGTPRYMAPELFKAGAESTKATDVYSFGVLLFFLVSGQFPVDGKSLGELKQAHLKGRANTLDRVRPGLPAAYLEIVTRATDRDPARRPTSAADLQSALASIAAPVAAVATPRSIGWWAAVAAGVGLLALLIVRPLFTPSAPPAPQVRSIAVLPIRNLTGDPSKAYIADGLTEVLISNLARIRSLRVPSFAAVAPFRDTSNPPADIAKKLGVQLLLAGSIVQAGTAVRLSVHLVDAAGTAVWGDEVTRETAGVMSAQADLSRRLASRMALDLTDAEPPLQRQSALDPRAQDAYLRGLALRVSSPSAQQEAARAFREAVEIEPTLADAWGHLALIETVFAERAAPAERERGRTVARELAQRAVDLDPAAPIGHVALGTIQFYSEWDFPAAEKSFREALAVAPSSGMAMQRYSMLLAALGRLDEAIAVAQQGQRLEPSVALRTTSLGTVYYYARDFASATTEMRRALSITPDFGVAHFGLGRIASAQGRHDQAIAEITRALEQSRNSAWLVELARAFAAAGRSVEARRVLDELDVRAKAGDRFSLDNLAYIAIAQGRRDEALRLLERAADQREAAMLWIAVDPRVDALHGDPRYDTLLARMNLRP